MRPLFIACIVSALAACLATPSRNADALLDDGLFKPIADPPRREEIFALSPAMREYLRARVKPLAREIGAPQAIHQLVHQDLALDYDAAMTRNAAQAFDARAGNCLSLVILTAALAWAVDVPVHYQTVFGYDVWSRAGGIAFRSGHINAIHSGSSDRDLIGRTTGSDTLTVDFIPIESNARTFTREISEDRLVAMYDNNRAAELLAAGEIEPAYWWARAAVKADPTFVAGYNTLGVIYRRHGDLREAERALAAVLEREPDQALALGNLAGVLDAEGRAAEAHQLRVRLERIDPVPPFWFLDQGRAAMARGDYAGARELLEKELRRMPYDDEVHFALAVVSAELGEIGQARRQLSLALENSTTRDRRGIYAAKLEHLKALEAH
ncbi:MAG TPA: tetratricopeptide repeat protein [Nevskiaceae bacterium]|nr:tetratricopeptide repeat protein [Nevskiaceae bacterium]